MPPTTVIATNLPPRPPPSSIVESIQRSPVLSPRITDPRQQRSGSLRPSSPPQRPSTPPQPPSNQKTENGSTKSGPIDMETFQQILDLDDDDFAWEMVEEYLKQAEKTFDDMDRAIKEKDCKELSSMGHFLKGSSATLGVIKLRDACELIQNYGDLRDTKAGKVLTPDVALSKIAATLREAREQYKEAGNWLKEWHKNAVTDVRTPSEDDDDD